MLRKFVGEIFGSTHKNNQYPAATVDKNLPKEPQQYEVRTVERPEVVIQKGMADAITNNLNDELKQLIQKVKDYERANSCKVKIEVLGLLKLALSNDLKIANADRMQLIETLCTMVNSSIELTVGLIPAPVDLAHLAMLAADQNKFGLLRDCLTSRLQINSEKKFPLGPILEKAALMGHQEIVSYLLNTEYVSPDEKIHPTEITVLQYVRSKRNENNKDCIKLLTEKSEAVKEELFNAIHNNEIEFVKELLADGIDSNLTYRDMTPLGAAVFSEIDDKISRHDIVNILLEKNADPDALISDPQGNKTTPYYLAIQYNQDESIALMTPKSKYAENVICEKIQNGSKVGEIKFYLDNGFSAKVKESSLLHQAVHYYCICAEEDKQNGEAIIMLLKEHHADPDRPINSKSALQLASEYQNKDCFQLLMSFSAETKKQMFLAAKAGRADDMEKVLSFGFDVKTHNEENLNLLQVGVICGHVNVVKVMLDYNAHPDHTIGDKQSAFEMAWDKQDIDYLKLLVPKSEQAKAKFYKAAEDRKENREKNREKSFGIAKQLLDCGINQKEIILNALEKDKIDYIEMLVYCGLSLDDLIDQEKSVLDLAREKNSKACIRFLINRSVAALRTLIDAIDEKKYDSIQLLLTEGLIPDQTIKGCLFPIEIARQNNDSECVKLLMSFSERAIRDLFLAAAKNELAKVKQLLDEGVNADAVMLRALQDKNPACVNALLEWGFDPDKPIQNDKSALAIANDNQDIACIKLLTPKSKAALNSLATLLRHSKYTVDELKAMEQLLADGVNGEKLSKECIENLKINCFALTKDHSNLLGVLDKNYVDEVGKWSKNEKHTHPLIADLNREITFLRDSKATENRDEFADSLEALRDHLEKKINKRRPKLNDDIQLTRIASETTYMLMALRQPKRDTLTEKTYQDLRLKIVENYKKECRKTSPKSKLLKILAMVFATAAGFVLGATIGVAIGMATGPGAFVAGPLGFFAGGTKGAMAAFAACTTGFTLTGFGLSGLLFKPQGVRKKALNTADLAKKFVSAP